MLKWKRRVDTPARIGGEEFALLLPDTDERGAFLVAERLRRATHRSFAEDPLRRDDQLRRGHLSRARGGPARADARRRPRALRGQGPRQGPHRDLQPRGGAGAGARVGLPGRRPPARAADVAGRGARRARHRQRRALAHGRPLRAHDGRGARPDRRARGARARGRRAPRRGQDRRVRSRAREDRARSATRTGASCGRTPRSARSSCRDPSSPTCAHGCSRTTSAPTEPATRSASRETRSRSRRRILAVADAYEAMTRGRVYREALGARRRARSCAPAPARSSTAAWWKRFLGALERERNEELEPPAATVTK